MKDLLKAKDLLRTLRKAKPVILNLTNFVTMDLVANALLALGAAPVMSVMEDELEELVQISSAVYVNIGTLDEAFAQRARVALSLAERMNKPVVLDPVGAGATRARTSLAIEFSKRARIIRGNASEIIALGTGQDHATKGVESAHAVSEAESVAMSIAIDRKAIVAVSGAIDFITDGVHHVRVDHGDALMARVTGMGCAVSAVIAAFMAVTADSLEATHAAMLYFALCGEIAAQRTNVPGTFRAFFLDALYGGDSELSL